MTARPYPQVKQTTFSLEEISRRADPEWVRDRNYITAYKFTGKSFTDHRDRCYQVPDED